MKKIAFAGLVFCMLHACANKKLTNNIVAAPDVAVDSPTENKPLENTYWVLTELNGKPVAIPDSTEKPNYIYFNAERSRVSVTGGCNMMGGTYQLLAGNRIKFGQMISTMMACPDMSIEMGLKRMTEMVDNYAISGDNLSFAKAKMAPVARFKSIPAPPDFSTE